MIQKLYQALMVMQPKKLRLGYILQLIIYPIFDASLKGKISLGVHVQTSSLPNPTW
jgi:hypothetical protein